ncbi:MAG: hypothetical protein ACXADA_13385 [Candidatus Hodarchaeales archaeon]|jgi:hypothetical protein
MEQFKQGRSEVHEYKAKIVEIERFTSSYYNSIGSLIILANSDLEDKLASFNEKILEINNELDMLRNLKKPLDYAEELVINHDLYKLLRLKLPIACKNLDDHDLPANVQPNRIKRLKETFIERKRQIRTL